MVPFRDCDRLQFVLVGTSRLGTVELIYKQFRAAVLGFINDAGSLGTFGCLYLPQIHLCKNQAIMKAD